MKTVTAVVLIVAAACSPCLIQAITVERTDLTEQYRPFFTRIKSIADQKYLQSTDEYNVLVKQLNLDLDGARSITTANINAIKNITAESKKQAINSTLATACLRAQDAELAKLTIAPINTCNSNANLTNLVNIKAKFTTLSNLANNVIYWCQNLSPLDTQDESYKNCLTLKAPDLGIQLSLVDREYNQVSNATLEYRIACISETTSGIFARISSISFEVNMCLQRL